jgi:hypothetical protein
MKAPAPQLFHMGFLLFFFVVLFRYSFSLFYSFYEGRGEERGEGRTQRAANIIGRSKHMYIDWKELIDGT